MKLKKKICITTGIFAVLGMIFPLIIWGIFRQFYIVICGLIWGGIVANICSYINKKNIMDIKYNKCEWGEYKEFIENGYYWLGRKIYFYKGITKEIELLECLILTDDMDRIPEIITKLLCNTHKVPKEEIQIRYLLCIYLWKKNKKKEFLEEKQKIYSSICNKKQLELDIYENFFIGNFTQAYSKLKMYSISCKLDVIWRNYMIQLLPNISGEKEKFLIDEESSSVPKIKSDLPILKVIVLFVLILLIVLFSKFEVSYEPSVKKAFEDKHFIEYRKENVLFEKENGEFRIEIQKNKKAFLFLIYEIEEKGGNYKLIKEWERKKIDLWKADEKETLISDVWLSTQLCKSKCDDIRNTIDTNFLIGISRNKEINNLTILDTPFLEIVPVKSENEEWYVYYWEGKSLENYEKDNIVYTER